MGAPPGERGNVTILPQDEAKTTYSSGEAARFLGIPARTLRRYLTRGWIAASQNPITGSWVIPRASLLAFLRQRGLQPFSEERP